MITNIIKIVIDMIFPPRCPFCDEILTISDAGVCKICKEHVSYVEQPYCMKCGKPIENEEDEFCKDCIERPHSYDEGRAVLVYDEYASRSVYRFKYNSKQEYAAYYGRIIDEKLHDKIMSWNAEAIIPVPIHKSKLKVRGYNQATLIARELSKHVNIPVYEHLLTRSIPTKVMKNLDAKERENNLKKAFIVNKNSVKLNSVIIVDDIYTTGSTIDAISALLKGAGVDKVYFVSLCIGRGY